METKTQYELSVLRYTPDSVRGEFVNIAVFLTKNDGSSFVGMRHTSDWNRVKRMFPGADTAFLQDWCAGLEKELAQEANSAGKEALTKRISESLSNAISISLENKALLGDRDPQKELERLAAQYVD